MSTGIYIGSLLMGIMIGIIISLAVLFFKDKKIKSKAEAMADILFDKKNKQKEVKNARENRKDRETKYPPKTEGDNARVKGDENKGETESKGNEFSNPNSRDRIFEQARGNN